MILENYQLHLIRALTYRLALWAELYSIGFCGGRHVIPGPVSRAKGKSELPDRDVRPSNHFLNWSQRTVPDVNAL
jgi:hypothetical protein